MIIGVNVKLTATDATLNLYDHPSTFTMQRKINLNNKNYTLQGESGATDISGALYVIHTRKNNTAITLMFSSDFHFSTFKEFRKFLKKEFSKFFFNLA